MDIFVLAGLIVLLGLFFDYTNGFHDAANVVATVIATRVLAPMTAIVLAGVLNTIGATQISGVVATITTGIVDSATVSQLAILAAVAGAIFWNILTWYFGVPSSSSYVLIGGLVGSAWASTGVGSIIWKGVLFKVMIPMIVSPIIGYFVAFIFMKGLVYCAGKKETKLNKLFAHFQIGSASIMALSHGLNDAQKSMGLITLGLYASGLLSTQVVPVWVILSCALMMGLGTASGGMRIIKTVGFSITKLRPMQGVAAELSASSVILSASFLGMPISSTHMIVGSVTGVGAAKDIKSVRWPIMKKLIWTWIIVLPGSALMSALCWKGFSFLSFLLNS